MKLEDIPEVISKLSDGCPCHAERFKGLPRQSRDRILSLHFGQHVTRCPVQGVMHPEIVAGDLAACADAAFVKLETDMRKLRLPPGVTPLSQADWDDVMLNLHAGKSGQTAVFNLKIHHLQTLPYCLPALALSDEDEARRRADQMIQQFEKDQRPEAHHPTIVHFCSAEVLRSGSTLNVLPAELRDVYWGENPGRGCHPQFFSFRERPSSKRSTVTSGRHRRNIG